MTSRPTDRAVAELMKAAREALHALEDAGMAEQVRLKAALRELDASAGGGEPVAWEIQFGKDVPAMMLVQSPDFVRSEARAIKVCELLGGGTTYRAVYTASPADDAGVRVPREALARMDECRAGCNAGDPFYADVRAWDAIRPLLAASTQEGG